MATNKRKQDEKHLKLLREMVSLPSNKTCFDCHQRGPTYVNMTIGSFVCTSCSGIMRGLNPPHRVKSISMASFTPDEMEFLKSHGNELNRKVYLGLYDNRLWPEPDSRDEQKVRDYMVQKYENKRWYVAPTEAMKEDAKRANEAALNSKPQAKPLRSLLGENTPKLVVGGSHSTSTPNHPPPVRAPTASSHQQPSQPQAAPVAAQPTSGFDLLSDLGNSDPFASANTAPAATDNGFADFSNFGNFNNTPSQPLPQAHTPQQQHQQQTPVQSSVQAPSPFLHSTPLVPMGSNSNTANPLTPASQATPSSSSSTASTFSAISDRYAALADLDSAFSTPVTTAPAINWGGPEGGSGGGAINWGGNISSTVQPSQPPTSVQWSGGSGGGVLNWNSQAPAASAAPTDPMSQHPGAGFGVTSTGHPGNPFLTHMAANPFGSSSATGMPAFSSPGATANPFGGNIPSSMSTPFSQPNSSAAPAFGAQFPAAQTQQQAGFGQFPVQNGGFGVAPSPYGQSAGAGFGTPQQQQFMMQQQQQQQQQQQPGGWGQPMAASSAGQPVVNPFMNTAMQPSQVPPPSGATNPFL